MNKESCNQEKISEKTSQELLTRLEATKSLIFGLIAGLEAQLDDTDSEEPDKSADDYICSAGDWFIVDKKIILSTFGNYISEEFRNLNNYLKELKTFKDLI